MPLPDGLTGITIEEGAHARREIVFHFGATRIVVPAATNPRATKGLNALERRLPAGFDAQDEAVRNNSGAQAEVVRSPVKRSRPSAAVPPRTAWEWLDEG